MDDCEFTQILLGGKLVLVQWRFIMKVFVTGATGFVGSAVVQELLANGHTVTGLARSQESADRLKALKVNILRGDLTDLESLKKGAEDSDGIIHTGFIHYFSKFKECCETDRRAIEIFGEIYAGSNRPLVVTSGFADIENLGNIINENMNINSDPKMTPRESEQTALRLAKEKNINTRIVRLAPAVHGISEHDGFMAGFVSVLIGIARRTGVSAYVGEGDNLWPGVHRLDAGKLFRLALEKGTQGERYHGVENAGTSFKDIATAVGKKLNLPVKSLSEEEAAKHFAWFLSFTKANMASSHAITTEKLGWKPTQDVLLKDLEKANLPSEDKY